MTYTTQELLDQIAAREDSQWEFKRVEFAGTRLRSPERRVLADEIAAFANARGGVLLCGVTEDGQVQDLTGDQVAALDDVLVEVSTDAIKPPVRIQTHHRRLPDGKFLVAVEVPQGDSHHRSPGGSFVRVGGTKRRMATEEQLRLAQRRGQARYLWFDEQPVPHTGVDTLDAELWLPLLSAEGAADPPTALAKLAVLAQDEFGVQRVTVAGVLLCARRPDRWLSNATITATRYRGTDRTTGQVDAQEITGPLPRQIADAVTFAVRNMHVAARKTPMRVDMPQYSEKAIFEAVVNAVVHRDYSVRGSRIRLSMFSDRLEIQSPGALPNTLSVESMAVRQATRNQAIASLMGRIGVEDIPGSTHRRYFMERRGDGVPAIIRETRELSGRPPEYRLIDDAEVLLRIPAAPQDATSSRVVVTVRAGGRPLPVADVLALFPNRTWKQAVADDNGEAAVDLYTTELPMTIFCAAPGHAACVVREWLPAAGALAIELIPLPQGGSAIFPEATGHLPGLKGRLNPKRDSLDRTYLYASNIVIGQGRPQPVFFVPGEELQLTDSGGKVLLVRIIEILGRSALVEYRDPERRE